MILVTTLSFACVFAMDGNGTNDDDLSDKIPRIPHNKIEKVSRLVSIKKNRATFLNHPDCQDCNRLMPKKKSKKNRNAQGGEITHGKRTKPRGHVFSENSVYSPIDFQVKGSKNKCFIGFYDKEQKINFLGTLHSLKNKKVESYIKDNKDNLSVYLLSTDRPKMFCDEVLEAFRFFQQEDDEDKLPASPPSRSILLLKETTNYIVMGPRGVEQFETDPRKLKAQP